MAALSTLFGALLIASGQMVSSASPIQGSDFVEAGPNWEEYINKAGYTARRFKKGMDPGSEDYNNRFGGREFSLYKRDDGTVTQPYAGKTEIAYRCDVDITDQVLELLNDLCEDTQCDEGSSAEAQVTYPDDGRETDYSVVLTAEGSYPSGQKGAFIAAIKEIVEQGASSTRDVLSSFPGSSHVSARVFECPVRYSSNYFSVVLREAGDFGGQTGNLDVNLEFGEDGGDICGPVLDAVTDIASAISHVGPIFPIVNDIICATPEQ